MSVANRLKEYLEEQRVPYTHCTHRLAYTAQEVAAAQHVPGRQLAKTIVLKADSQYILLALPAIMKVDLKMLRDELPFKHIELATEREFAALFPDCELGAMAPFGNVYHLPVYVDKSLTTQDEITFNAGTHVDTIRIKYADFARLVRPQLIRAALPAELAVNR